MKETGIVLAVGGALLLLYFLFSGKLGSTSPTLGVGSTPRTQILPGTAVGTGGNARAASFGYPGVITPQGPAVNTSIAPAAGFLGAFSRLFSPGISPSPATPGQINAAAEASPATKSWYCSEFATIQASQAMSTPTGMTYGPPAPLGSGAPSPSQLTSENGNCSGDTLLSSIPSNQPTSPTCFPGSCVQGGGNAYVAPVAAIPCVGAPIGPQCLSTVCV
jgi:hypothetical protein